MNFNDHRLTYLNDDLTITKVTFNDSIIYIEYIVLDQVRSLELAYYDPSKAKQEFDELKNNLQNKNN